MYLKIFAKERKYYKGFYLNMFLFSCGRNIKTHCSPMSYFRKDTVSDTMHGRPLSVYGFYNDNNIYSVFSLFIDRGYWLYNRLALPLLMFLEFCSFFMCQCFDFFFHFENTKRKLSRSLILLRQIFHFQNLTIFSYHLDYTE